MDDVPTGKDVKIEVRELITTGCDKINLVEERQLVKHGPSGKVIPLTLKDEKRTVMIFTEILESVEKLLHAGAGVDSHRGAILPGLLLPSI